MTYLTLCVVLRRRIGGRQLTGSTILFPIRRVGNRVNGLKYLVTLYEIKVIGYSSIIIVPNLS